MQTGVFNIKQRRIFQIIETDAAHFTEIEAGAVMICLTSLAEVLDGEAGKIKLHKMPGQTQNSSE